MKSRANNGELRPRYNAIKRMIKSGMKPKEIQRSLGITKRAYYNALRYFEPLPKAKTPKGCYVPFFPY